MSICITLVLVNFTAPSYRAGFNASVVIVRVTAFGSFDLAFLVEAVPDAVNIPEGMIATNYSINRNLCHSCFNRGSIF